LGIFNFGNDEVPTPEVDVTAQNSGGMEDFIRECRKPDFKGTRKSRARCESEWYDQA